MPTAIAIRQVPGKPGKVWYPLEKMEVEKKEPGPDEVQIRIHAAALNHRDLFLRQHLYPGTTFSVPLLADGCGTITRTGSSVSPSLLHKRVILNPGTGWDSSPLGPESPSGYAILGGTKFNPVGTLSEYVIVKAKEVELAPEHLTTVEAAALPLTGLTAWRATVTKSGACKPDHNILVTGIGGGVAIMALLFAVASGARVWVTSGSEEKIAKAKALGAQGGVSYRKEGWEKVLLKMLPKDRARFDAVIDGAGGDIVAKSTKLLRPGGVIVSYGMTLAPKVPFLMSAVLQNIDLRGSTMGSRKEFADMCAFVRAKKVRPVVSRSVRGIDNFDGIEGLFDDMRGGTQFGKLVIEVGGEDDVGGKSKL